MVSDDSPAKTAWLMASSNRIVMEVTSVSRTRSLLAIGVNILVVVSFREPREPLRVFDVERNAAGAHCFARRWRRFRRFDAAENLRHLRNLRTKCLV